MREYRERLQIKEPEWLWKNKFHYGGLSLIAGLPKQGKSMLTSYMAAVITNGWNWCDGNPCEQGSVLFFAGEDSPEEYARRLKGNRADLTKIRILESAVLSDGNSEGKEIEITMARLDVLEAAIIALEEETGSPCRMVVIDPISNFWGKGVNENSQSDVRPVLFPLQQFFQKWKIAPILIQHLKKSTDPVAMLRITGSIAIAGTCRNLWGVYTDPQDPAPKLSEKKRFLVPYPGNVCIDPTGISFVIIPPDGRIDVVDCGIEKTGNDFEAAWQQHGTGKGQSTEKLEVKEWLRNYLADGSKPANEIWEAAKAERFAEKTVKKAKSELDIKSRQEWDKEAKKSIWFWDLPPDTDTKNVLPDPESQPCLPLDPSGTNA